MIIKIYKIDIQSFFVSSHNNKVRNKTAYQFNDKYKGSPNGIALVTFINKYGG